MDDHKPELLVVDDSPSYLELMTTILSKEFAVFKVSSGEEAIAGLESGLFTPKAIFLDVSMPGMDGYQTCQTIKQNPMFEAIDVIFVSGHDTIEEKSKGYEAGASDFIVKPVQAFELVNKAHLAIARMTQLESASLESQSAMQTAMTAITDAGEQATVVHFMRESFQCTCSQDLAKLIVNSTSSFGLDNSLIINALQGSITASSSANISPLELEVLSSLKNAGRIQQIGRRLILNFGSISLFVKNLPNDDEFRCGRLRDHLALILEAATSRLQALTLMNEMKTLLDETQASIEKYQQAKITQKEENIKIMDDLLVEINENLFKYGLTEEQEDVLIQLVEKYNSKTLSVYEKGSFGDSDLRLIADKLARSVHPN